MVAGVTGGLLLGLLVREWSRGSEGFSLVGDHQEFKVKKLKAPWYIKQTVGCFFSIFFGMLSNVHSGF